MESQPRTINFFFRANNSGALVWKKKIESWLKKKYPRVKISESNPQALIVLGGDGTILEATRQYEKSNPIIFGLNLGNVGFLASVRKQEEFLISLNQFLGGNYWVAKKMMLSASVIRNNKRIFSTDSLNDIAIESPLSMVELKVSIEEHPIQYIRGTGVLISSATGSTAFNLSSHGPIIMPDIKCFIITEILDHNIPTPSIVIKRNRRIDVRVVDFRERGTLSITKNNQKIDVVLISDGETIFPLQKGDTVKIKRSPRLVKFAELDKHYFFKSLQEKFTFK